MSNATVENHPDTRSEPIVFGEGTLDGDGENLGRIQKLMNNMETGRTPYAVLSFGGVVAISDKLFAIPLQALKLQASHAEGLRAEGNKDLCRRFIQKIFNESELTLIGDYLSPDVVNHELAGSLGDNDPRGQNIQWMADLLYIYRRAFPNLHVEILDQIAEGEKVATRLRMRGTQTSALMTIPASGNEIDVTGIRIDRVLDGKIVESWFQLDMFGMLTQIEALPAINRHTQKMAPASRETAPGWRLPAGLTPDPALPHPAV